MSGLLPPSPWHLGKYRAGRREMERGKYSVWETERGKYSVREKNEGWKGGDR